MLVLLTVLWCCSNVKGQGAVSTQHRLDTEVTGEAWHYSNYPNPRAEPGKCNRKRSSWVCDPDGILKPQQADEFDALIGSIRRTTLCPCDVSICSSNRHGYTVSIAIVNKFYRISTDYSTLMSDARNFAFSLERERWKFDKCDDDIIIFYSRQDHIVFAVTGMRARHKVPDDVLHEIVMDSTQFFQHNAYMGLKHMIYGIRHALQDKFHAYRGEKRYLQDIYSYRRRARPRVESTLGGEGRMVGSYAPSTANLQRATPAAVLMSGLIYLVFNIF